MKTSLRTYTHTHIPGAAELQARLKHEVQTKAALVKDIVLLQAQVAELPKPHA